MLEVAELIERFGPSFCVLPWIHLDINMTGVCKACCMTLPLRDIGSEVLSVYESSLDDVWNSDSIRAMRRAMVFGEEVPDCLATCIVREKSGGLSRRLMENRRWENEHVERKGVSIADLKTEAIKNNFRIHSLPVDLTLEADNLCNLACRMCNPGTSSRVEHDSVHKNYEKRTISFPTWRNNSLDVLPLMLYRVTYYGFREYNDSVKDKVVWIAGAAEIRIALINEYIECLAIRLSSQSLSREIHVCVNGELVYSTANGQANPRDILVKLGRHYEDLYLNFDCCDTSVNSSSDELVGFGLERVTVKRSVDKLPGTEMLYSRFPGKRHWIQEDDFVFGELLTDNVQLQRVTFSGGEPLINPNVLRLIHLLSKSNSSKQITLCLATNGTVYNTEVFDLAKDFRLLCLSVSVDAIGPVNEYIRHGTKMQEVESNLHKMALTKNVFLMISSTINAYNVLEFSNVLRFCDCHGLVNYANFITNPDYLSMNVLPPSVRKIASQRLNEYAATDDGILANKKSAIAHAQRLDLQGLQFDPSKLQKFMIFTNDLDRSRKQCVRKTLPELVQLLESAGYPWADETKYWGAI